MLTCPRTCSRTPSTAAPRCVAPARVLHVNCAFQLHTGQCGAAAPPGRPQPSAGAPGRARLPVLHACAERRAVCALRRTPLVGEGSAGRWRCGGCDGRFGAAGGGGARRDTAGGAAAPPLSGWRGGCAATAREGRWQGEDPCCALAAPARPRGVSTDAPRPPDRAGGCFQPPAQALRGGLASKLQHPRTVRPLCRAAAAPTGRSARSSGCQPHPARAAHLVAAS